MNNQTIVTLADAADTYHFRAGETYVLDDTTWRPARWTDRLKWWLKNKLRLGAYSRVTAVDFAEGQVSLEIVRWSWLRMKWVVVL